GHPHRRPEAGDDPPGRADPRGARGGRHAASRRLRDRLPAHERHPRRGARGLPALLALLHGRRGGRDDRPVLRGRGPGQRGGGHVPARDHPAHPHQVHRRELQREPGDPRRGHLVRQRRALRRHPQPRPGHHPARLPRGPAHRLGGRGQPHDGDGRGGAGRDARVGHEPVPRGAQPAAREDRGGPPPARGLGGGLQRVRDPRAADDHDGPQGAGHGGRPGAHADPRGGREGRTRLRRGRHAPHAAGGRGGRAQADRVVARRDLPRRDVRRRPGHGARPRAQRQPDAGQGRRRGDVRLHGHVAREPLALPRPCAGRGRPHRQLRLLVRLLRPADLERDVPAVPLRHPEGDGAQPGRPGRHELLGDGLHGRT
ncbi:MAG: Acetophenone carboxylase subunit Apc4, partial [uncultured Solirubrobacteraceae bacterium]